MSRHFWRLAALLGVSAVLFLWPFLSPELAMKWLADKLSAGSFITLCRCVGHAKRGFIPLARKR